MYLLLEVFKGLVRSAVSWTPVRKRSIALLSGACIGALLSLAGPVAWWIGMVAGLLGAGVPVGGRALGTGLRRGGFAGVAAGVLAACLLNCGVGAASSCIQAVAGSYRIDGPALGYSAIGCALPCLARFGFVEIATYASAPARWGGSAGERDTCVQDRIVVTVKPRPAPCPLLASRPTMPHDHNVLVKRCVSPSSSS